LSVTIATWTILSLIDPDRATVQLLTVKGCNRICCFRLLGHGDEAQASASTCFVIDDDLGFLDGAVCRKGGLKRIVVSVPG